MSLEHFDRFFAFVAVGLGLFLAGGLNLVFGRGGRRVWLRIVVTLAVCGAMVAGLSALTRPELALRSGGLMIGTLGLVAALGSERVSRRLAALLATLQTRTARWGLVGLAGVGVVLAGVVVFETTDEQLTDQQMKDMELVAGKPNTKPSDRAHAATDRGSAVVLREATDPRDPGELGGAEAKMLQTGPFGEQIIRRGGANEGANCHGWVFTGGRFHLAPEDVEKIVKENGYQEVHEPQPGDLVVYRQGGIVSHTAIVRYVTEGQPVLVEGKWGAMGVYLHPADRSCYGTQYTFHRSARAGHVLVGLGGSPGPTETTNVTVE